MSAQVADTLARMAGFLAEDLHGHLDTLIALDHLHPHPAVRHAVLTGLADEYALHVALVGSVVLPSEPEAAILVATSILGPDRVITAIRTRARAEGSPDSVPIQETPKSEGNESVTLDAPVLRLVR